jgi:hypothetical protein
VLVRWPAPDGRCALTGYTLAENTAMLKVFTDAGLPVHHRTMDGVVA